MNGAPVGRSSEWRAFVDWLTAEPSGLLVIQGEPGSGRTHLMRSFGAHAKERGYVVVGCDEELPIESTTQIADLSRALGAVLGLDAAETREVAGFWASVVHEFKTGLTEERDLLAILDEGPLLVGIDGYAPSPGLERWMLGSLLTSMKKAEHGLVLVLVDRDERMARAREKADLVFSVGPLDREELQEYFTSLSDSLDTPLSALEVERYSEASATDPTVFEALDIVLQATARGAR